MADSATDDIVFVNKSKQTRKQPLRRDIPVDHNLRERQEQPIFLTIPGEERTLSVIEKNKSLYDQNSRLIDMNVPEGINLVKPMEKFYDALDEARTAFNAGKDASFVDEKIFLDAKILASKRSAVVADRTRALLETQRASELFEVAKRTQKLREQYYGSAAYGNYGTPPSITAFNQEYIPLMMGPFYRQPYLYYMLDGKTKSYYAFHHYPVVSAAMKLKRDFIYGRGFDVRMNNGPDDDTNETMQEIWDGWSNKEDFPLRFGDGILDGSIDGEVAARWFPDKKNPRDITFRWIDCSSIWEIITQPDDLLDIKAYWQQYASPALILTVDNVPISQYFIRTIPPEEIDFMRLNVMSSEKRGRSDVFPALTESKWLRDYLWSTLVREKVRDTWLWDITLKGNISDVNNIQAQFPTQQNPGTGYIHNDRISFDPKAPNWAPQSRFILSNVLIGLIAVTCGIPKEYVSAEGGGSRAAALLASEPATKHFQERQDRYGWLCQQFIMRVMKNAQRWGRLPKNLTEDQMKGSITWPEITKEDRSAKLNDLKLGESMGWWSKRTSFAVATAEMSMKDLDFDEEQVVIMADKAKGYYGEYFNDQNPQGVAGPMPAIQDAQGSSVPPKEEPTNLDIQKDKNIKNNPFSQGSAGLRKQLKNAADGHNGTTVTIPSSIMVKISERDLA